MTDANQRDAAEAVADEIRELTERWDKMDAGSPGAQGCANRLACLVANNRDVVLAALASLPAASEQEQWDAGSAKLIKEAAELIKPADGEAVFYIRVGGTQTQLSVKTLGDVDPDIALQNAISALNGEREDLSNCPIHAPSDQEKLDAARYRWLRDHSCPPHNFYISVPAEFSGVRYSPSDVDGYIDDARARQNGEVG